MSLHRPVTIWAVGEHPAGCACGWRGVPTIFTSERDAAYDAHVQEVLGVNAFYSASAACRNCGHEQTATVLVGRPVTSAHCERCGMDGLLPRNDVADEYSRERGQR